MLLGKAGDVLDAGIAVAAFDTADISPVDIGKLGQFFLGEAFSLTVAL